MAKTVTPPQHKIVFVLGMHRSGTSLIAKAAQVAGAELGDHLMQASEDNPKGFWEDIDIFEFNERLLKFIDIRWDIPSLLPSIDFSDPKFDPPKREAMRILKPKLSAAPVLAIKDPRISLLMPFWMDVIRIMKLEVQFVVAVRHPLDVTQSLSARDHFDEQKSLTLWRNYNFLLIKALTSLQGGKLFVDYEKILAHPKRELDRLTRFISGTEKIVSSSNPPVKSFLNDFVDQSLSHSQSSQDALNQLNVQIPGLLPLYQCMKTFANGQWSKDKAEITLNQLSIWELEANNYRLQLHHFNQDLHHSLEAQHQSLEIEKQEALELVRQDKDDTYNGIIERKDKESQSFITHIASEFKQILERKDRELNEQAQAQENLKITQENTITTLKQTREALQKQEINALQREQEINTLQRANQFECARLQAGWDETDRHLLGSLHRIKAIEQSLSYRLGRALTWPIRISFELIIAPFHKIPGNFRVLTRILYFIVRHPLKSLSLLSWTRIKNAYITFYKNPAIAKDVVNYYSRLLHGDSATQENLFSVKHENQSSSLTDIDFDSKTVSLITVNYNGRNHLFDLLTSLLNQNYQDREIILVDNASIDGSVEFVRDQFPQVRVIALTENVGFAEANNVAAELATGRYYCLVNNDTQADPDWLTQLVNCIECSETIGAVGPKILFWKTFATINLNQSTKTGKATNVYLNMEALEASAPIYPKFFFMDGISDEQIIDGKRCRKLSRSAQLRVAIFAEQATLAFHFRCEDKKKTNLELASPVLGSTLITAEISEQWASVNMDFSNNLNSDQLVYLINNAASQINDNGEVNDRGFGTPDIDIYNHEEKVSALCGGAMLIRPEALQGKPIFSQHFFAYFEDTDLSIRIRKSGYELVYCPDSIIYHKHASTTREHSPFFRFHVERNKVLFYALHFPPAFWKEKRQQAQENLQHLQQFWQANDGSTEELQFAAMIPKLFTDWEKMLPMIEQGHFFDRPQRLPKIAIYDNFWCTLGGGEHHASIIAQALQSLGRVDLLAEQPFEISALEQQFGVDLRHCRRRLLTSAQLHQNPETTRQYDIFINSTYSSDLKCHSRYSFYVVSFPFDLKDRPDGSDEFLQTYTAFLANSRYTAGWIKKWWHIESQVLYPTIKLPNNDPSNQRPKEKLILHVGRFFQAGHNKKQLELVHAFKSLIDKRAISSDWRLVLVGQFDQAHQEYVDEVKQAANGYPIEIMNNLPLKQLNTLYGQAAIYWHATGLGENQDKHPQLYEHFGITTVEAMSYGCVPIVINAGGQPEIVEHEKNGFLFNTQDQLENYTATCASLFIKNPSEYQTLSRNAYQQSLHFGRDTMLGNLTHLLETTGYSIASDIKIY